MCALVVSFSSHFAHDVTVGKNTLTFVYCCPFYCGLLFLYVKQRKLWRFWNSDNRNTILNHAFECFNLQICLETALFFPRFFLQCYMRALYDYDPQEDTLLPCKEIGLAFERGDILQIVDQRDPNWWQAKKVNGDGAVGLIPSMELEERRKAFVAPEADFVHKISICGARISKKKKKIIYKSKSNSDFDKAELLLYEEVTRMPPFKRKTLVLIGTQGVGRRTIKNRLINSDPDKFGSVVPCKYQQVPQ